MRSIFNGDGVDTALLSPVEAADSLLKQLQKPVRLLVAISGGSDSTGLLLALHEIARLNFSAEVQIVAATVDHGLRAEARQEADAVAALCKRYSIEHTILRWEGDKPRTGIAAAARAARYEILVDAAEALGADAILTGHTLDDQIETVAMRSLRGQSPEREEGEEPHLRSGEAGMAHSVLLHQKIWLLRPFLHTRREHVRKFLEARGEGWIDDPSNENTASERVRTRRQLAGLDDGKAVAHLAGILSAQAARRSLADSAATLFAEHLSLSNHLVAHLPVCAQKGDCDVLSYALGRLIAVLGGREHAPPADRVRQIAARLAREERFSDTLGRVLLVAKRQGLYLVRESRDLPVPQLRPEERVLWDGRFLLSANKSVNVGEMPDLRESLQGFPPAIVEAACHASWQMQGAQAFSGGAIEATPVLRPWLQFLPEFDWKLANSMTDAMGLVPFVPSPLNALCQKR